MHINNDLDIHYIEKHIILREVHNSLSNINLYFMHQSIVVDLENQQMNM